MRAFLRWTTGLTIGCAALAALVTAGETPATPETEKAAPAIVANPPATPKEKNYGGVRVRQFFLPPGYDGAKKFPAILTFVGLGMNHVDDGIWPLLAEGGFVVMAANPANNDCQPAGSYKDIFAAIGKDVAIDEKQIFGLGFSRWGCAGMGAVLREPDAFRGCVAVCHCWFESTPQCPNAVPALTTKNADLRFLVVAGEKDMNTIALRPLAQKYQAQKFLLAFQAVDGLEHLLRKEEAPIILAWLREQLDAARNEQLMKSRKKVIADLEKAEAQVARKAEKEKKKEKKSGK